MSPRELSNQPLFSVIRLIDRIRSRGTTAEFLFIFNINAHRGAIVHLCVITARNIPSQQFSNSTLGYRTCLHSSMANLTSFFCCLSADFAGETPHHIGARRAWPLRGRKWDIRMFFWTSACSPPLIVSGLSAAYILVPICSGWMHAACSSPPPAGIRIDLRPNAVFLAIEVQGTSRPFGSQHR
jgi:hypothetical protein